MKALSLWQPWASLIAIGAKTIETRSWGTPYRGWLAIHAGISRGGLALCEGEPFRSALEAAGTPTYRRYGRDRLVHSALPFGAIVAVVNLHHVGEIRRAADGNPFVYPKEWSVKGDELAFGDYTLGRKGWILTNPHPLKEPIPCRGSQGLWEVPGDVEENIWRQLGMPRPWAPEGARR